MSRSLLVASLIGNGAAADVGPIHEIRFDWSSYRTLASGSDNWPLTWCEDDHQYTAWGDGGGFGGTNTEYRVSLGFARIQGDYDTLQTQNLWGGKDPVAPAEFTGKVHSIFCVDGVLYAWRSPGAGVHAFDWKQLIVSPDKGVTWLEDALPESRVAGCIGCPGLPYTINYGRNYEANTDGYVYTYWIQIQDPLVWEVQIPGVLWLVRAPLAGNAFQVAALWEWFTGFDASQNPQWGAFADRAPVLEDPEGMLRGSAVYVPGLDRFLMVTNHTERNEGNIAIWQAPQPWGPWSAVLRDYDWPASDPDAPVGPRFTFGSFSPRWFSPDGRRGVFVWFRPDQWNSVEFEILAPEVPGVPAWAHPLLGSALLGAGVALRRGVARRDRSSHAPPEAGIF